MNSSANVWVPILLAIVTGLITVVTVYLTGRASLKLEQEKFDANSKLEQLKFETNSKLEDQKFQSSLVLQAIATGKRQAQKNLDFLVSAGLLSDPEGKIKEAAKRYTPVLPARAGAPRVEFQAPVFRGKVRTGSDPDALHVKETPVQTSVEELGAKPRPAGMESLTEIYPAYQDHRTEGVERTIYEVEATIISCKVQASGFYHLGLRGKSGQTMIANCVVVDPESRWAKQIAAVRKEVAAKLVGTPFAGRNPRVRITGVGYFSRNHGQRDRAPNSIELTPVLKIEWLS